MILHKIKPTQILPIVMILLDLGAAVVCVWHKEYKKGCLLGFSCGAECDSDVLKGEENV